MNRIWTRLYISALFLLLACSFNVVAAPSEDKKSENKSSEKEKRFEQDDIFRKEVLSFMREHKDRERGEGWLYLARQYRELGQTDRALIYLRTLLRSDHISSEIIWEAKLLEAEIRKEREEYELALKELDRLIKWNPEREYFVRAKLARARILGRNLTSVEELQKALKEYYWPFPEKGDIEAVEYLMGFSRGYDLEITMKALEAWEEIADFVEMEARDQACLHIGLLHAFDLSNYKRGEKWLEKLSYGSGAAIDAIFVKSILGHYYSENAASQSMQLYSEFRSKTDKLDLWRIAGILQGQLATEKIKNYEMALRVYSSLFETPKHLVASQSVSVEKRIEENDKEIDWAVLACKMAGYTAEYKMNDPDRARSFYQKAKEFNKERSKPADLFWIEAALRRTEPKVSQAQMLFDLAYEKYRSRKFRQAIDLYEEFIKKYPGHFLYREALFRIAVITDDDLRQYEEALKMYQRYMIRFAPVRSDWNLDVLYDWGRTDEVRYRIGNLLSLHLKDPVGALEVFAQLAATFPDSYWAQQGMKDSIEIYLDDLGDPDQANEMKQQFIDRYPDSKDASAYRLQLYKTFLSKEEQVKALRILRDYLDHELPSNKEYFAYKQQWRDLSFRIRENSLRRQIESAGKRDRLDLVQNLMDVLCLASSSRPLESLVEEIKQDENLDDELRWSMVYKAGTRLYRNFPEKSTAIFEELANNATGSAKLAAHLTLGNLAYRVNKSIEKAVFHYEQAQKMLPLTSALNELPSYRLGRLYLAQGRGLKGMETLVKFARRFRSSRYLGRAYMALGDACVALNSPEKAVNYYRRVMRVSKPLAEKAGEKLAELKELPTSQQWLEKRAKQIRTISIDDIASEDKDAEQKTDRLSASILMPVSNKPVELDEMEPESLYEMILAQGQSAKPDPARIGDLAYEILKRREVSSDLREKSLRHYISSRFFRRLNPEILNEEIDKLLAAHNYAEWQHELLFRLAQVRDYFLKEPEEANRAYFEYLSFYPDQKRAIEVRERIPRVFENAEDTKNAFRFYEKLIEDGSIPEDIRVKASMDVARLYIIEEKKNEAIKTLEAALAYQTDMRPEICLRLEKLTEDFSYVRRALDYEGNEEFRLKALQRLVAKAEEDENYAQAAGLLSDFSDTFDSVEAEIFIDKKVDELGKRGVIGEIERLIEFYPEEPETAERMFKLAKLVEGSENTKYRAQDLFYEITLVYPESEFYRESRIRAENVRTIKAVSELTDMFKRGLKGDVGEEVLIERARLLATSLKDLSGAMENYQSFIELFPDSDKLDEVYLAMGDIILAEKGSSREALKLYEKGLEKSRDPFVREDLTSRINRLQKFQALVVYSESEDQIEEGINQIYRVWRLERNFAYALGLLENAIQELHNRPLVARLHYLRGRIHQDNAQLEKAVSEYEKALNCLYHPGCRKDMLLYRIARIKASQNLIESAAAYYRALVHRYPKSLLSRSGLYQLYKYELKRKNLGRAHHYLDRLLSFKALFPSHREELIKKLKEVEARMNIEEMNRLRRYSPTGGGNLPYFIGKVLEYDLGDYDKAIKQYEDFLKTGPSIRKSREIMTRIADLYEKKGDFVKAVGYLDMLLDTYEPNVANFDLVFRIGSLVEDKLQNPELVNLFYESIVADYRNVRKIRVFAQAKLRRLEEKRLEAAKPRKKKIIKRVYSEDDEWVLEEMKAIIERQIDDLQDFQQAERQLEDLWDENPESLATLDIMKTLVKLNNEQLVDPQKAAMYYEKWLEANSHDPMYKEITLELYNHYMDVLFDGNKALRLLENFVRDNPVSINTLDIELMLGKANETRIGNFDEARRIYQRIIDTKQNDPIVHEAYFRMGFVMREGFANYDEAVKNWQDLIDLFYNNEFADRAQFAIAYTYEAYSRDYTKARQAYEKILNLYPNSALQNEARDALLRIEGK